MDGGDEGTGYLMKREKVGCPSRIRGQIRPWDGCGIFWKFIWSSRTPFRPGWDPNRNVGVIIMGPQTEIHSL